MTAFYNEWDRVTSARVPPVCSSSGQAGGGMSDTAPKPSKAISCLLLNATRLGGGTPVGVKSQVRVLLRKIRTPAARLGSRDRTSGCWSLEGASPWFSLCRSLLVAGGADETLRLTLPDSSGGNPSSIATCSPVLVQSEKPTHIYGNGALSRRREGHASCATDPCTLGNRTSCEYAIRGVLSRTPRNAAACGHSTTRVAP